MGKGGGGGRPSPGALPQGHISRLGAGERESSLSLQPADQVSAFRSRVEGGQRSSSKFIEPRLHPEKHNLKVGL